MKIYKEHIIYLSSSFELQGLSLRSRILVSKKGLFVKWEDS